jgi:putative mycofactocin binding protein MftB
VRGLLSLTDIVPAVDDRPFDPHLAWRVHPRVALRDESFGALAYHYGTRRLLFLKSHALVELVSSLHLFESAAAAMEALVPEPERGTYSRALARLAESEVIHAG